MRRVIPHEREKKCSRGRYGQTVNKRWAVTLCPSFLWQSFAVEGLSTQTNNTDVRSTQCCPAGSEPHARGGQPALGTMHRALQAAAPGSPGDRVHSLQRGQESAAPDLLSAKGASSPCCYGTDRNSFTAAEPITSKDRNSSQMTQDIVLRQSRSNFPMFSFKHHPFNKQPGFFQCLKSHGLNICMQLLQHQLFQLCLSNAAALNKHW